MENIPISYIFSHLVFIAEKLIMGKAVQEYIDSISESSVYRILTYNVFYMSYFGACEAHKFWVELH